MKRSCFYGTFLGMYVYDSMALLYFLSCLMVAYGLTYDVQYVKGCFDDYDAQADIFWCVRTRHYETMWLECEFPDQ